MKFEKLIIENFSSFYGRHTIEFNTTPEKPLTIIVGGGGKGKTSIFDALNWALYGAHYEVELEKESQKSILDLINETAVQDAKMSNESIETACSVFFSHDGKKYGIQHAVCVLHINNKLQITDRTAVLLEHLPNGNTTDIPHIDSFLNEILPNNVKDYFLFNGDRINELALPGASKEIRDGIYRVVDLELFQNGITHLTEVAKKFRKLAKANSTGEMVEIENDYSRAFEDLEDLREKLQNAINEKSAIEDNIEIISDKLRGMDEVKGLQSKRDILKERIDFLVNNKKQLVNELRYNSALAVGKFALPEIENLIDSLSDKRKKGEIPSTISERLIQDILDMHVCICETKFVDGDDIYENLNARLQREKEKEKTGQDLLDLYFELTTARNEILKSTEMVNTLETKRCKTEKTLEESERLFADTLKMLQNAPEEEISKLANKLQEYNSDLTEKRLDIQTYRSKIQNKEDNIKKIQLARDEIGKKQKDARRYQLRDDLAQKSTEELIRIFKIFADNSRKEVQDHTSREFKAFIPTAKALTIAIDPEFHYDIRDKNNNPALQQLSKGQKQALSLAYITAISKVSEKNPPLVIDYPLGRFDNDVQDNVASRLPDLASQIILLVLPGPEWNEHNKKILHPKCSDIYHLDFDEIKRQSRIIKES